MAAGCQEMTGEFAMNIGAVRLMRLVLLLLFLAVMGISACKKAEDMPTTKSNPNRLRKPDEVPK